ncbi:MAG: hypothetical protein HN813_11415, partial [Rhodospirillaceae bacterium]|nr:hypothetical protein [Rhodospirillaceae bacterium]
MRRNNVTRLLDDKPGLGHAGVHNLGKGQIRDSNRHVLMALLREMGVKKSLATLIEAESLLNDGTAVVVYSILLKAVQSEGLGAWLAVSSDAGGWYIVWVTVRMSIIGPLFGI